MSFVRAEIVAREHAAWCRIDGVFLWRVLVDICETADIGADWR